MSGLKLVCISYVRLLLAAAALAVGPAYADIELSDPSMIDKVNTTSPLPKGFVVGAVGLGYTPRYPDSQARTSYVIPGFIYLGDKVVYLGDRARYYFHRDGDFAAFAFGRLRFGSLEAEDAPTFVGIKKRRAELELGIGANWVTPYALLTTRISTDVTGASGGQEAMVWADFPLVRKDFVVMPGVGLMLRSANLANYYFGGISAEEAIPGRPAHDVGNSLSVVGSVFSAYRINAKWVLMATVAYEHYAPGIRSSPLIKHSGELTGLAGLGYVW